LTLAAYINMKSFKMEGGHVFVNHRDTPLFPLLNPIKTNYANPSNWSHNNDVDIESDNDEPPPQGGNIGGGHGGVGSSRATHT